MYLEENVAAASISLSDEEFATLDQAGKIRLSLIIFADSIL
jgi:aryl-alcohol dehydrogenase-like predicted oxidoreductase